MGLEDNKNTKTAPTLEDMYLLKEKYPGAVNVVSDGVLVMFTYTYANSDLFKERWGKEVRGITYHRATGTLISRPFHKFFNSGEPGAPKNFSPTGIAEKMDGSLLQISWNTVENRLFVASRSTLREDTSYVIKTFYKLPEQVIETLTDFAKQNPDQTHLFELLDPNNQIVIFYPELSVTYLLSRVRLGGEYVFNPPPGIQSVNWDSLNGQTLDDVVEQARHTEELEGWVLFDESLQDFVKIKTPWYLERHKVTELNLPEHYVTAWAEQTLDDFLSFARLANNERKAAIIENVNNRLNEIFENFMESQVVQEGDKLRRLPVRKDAAIGLKALAKEHEFGDLIFSAAMQTYGGDYQQFITQLQTLYRKSALKSNTTVRKLLLAEVEKILRA